MTRRFFLRIAGLVAAVAVGLREHAFAFSAAPKSRLTLDALQVAADIIAQRYSDQVVELFCCASDRRRILALADRASLQRLHDLSLSIGDISLEPSSMSIGEVILTVDSSLVPGHFFFRGSRYGSLADLYRYTLRDGAVAPLFPPDPGVGLTNGPDPHDHHGNDRSAWR